MALDITVSDELRREGIARELVNHIQNIRKSQGFEITDKIDVVVTPNAATDEAVREYADYIGRQASQRASPSPKSPTPTALRSTWTSILICRHL